MCSAMHDAVDEYDRPPATVEDLSPRQLEVAALIARAKTDKQIAATLGMSVRRVSNHVTALAYLLHLDESCNVRIQIAIWWRERVSNQTPHAA